MSFYDIQKLKYLSYKDYTNENLLIKFIITLNVDGDMQLMVHIRASKQVHYNALIPHKISNYSAEMERKIQIHTVFTMLAGKTKWAVARIFIS